MGINIFKHWGLHIDLGTLIREFRGAPNAAWLPTK
jgi:hypothetical protein